MCKRVVCPNDGLPTWWGCGQTDDQALAGVPKEDRCTCEHVPIPGRQGMYEVVK
ncbi:hypothetical protein TREMEDRAFT_20321, partial [Tremella mesenterica DSM 1558]|uniref:uncharacterized protein n=1 Tax=Tremella mesenterica (strain ATCC 24925 / CBS 8224 / DSM 1558 / NBRC 9311 / NRRL Y-6157 / RJB 2259-6 / UBC 559-6) TaxID=578456 RepID=UPI0003F49760